jgi:penicillin-binding protein 1C
LSLVSPVNGAHVTRDPDAAPGMSSLRLSVAVSAPVEQVVWYVDGAPFAVVGPPYEARWALEPGEHAFEARLPWRPERSAVATVLAR